jgi:hypothetical protein
MGKDEGARVRRYETIIATLVGVSALFVSGYTAYVQRQQVRAAVWPILEYGTSNEPSIHFSLDNKGVGPAIIRHVQVTVHGEPVVNWQGALEKMLGPGHHKFTESTMSGHVLSAGESMEIMTPHDDDGETLNVKKGGPLWTALNKARNEVAVDVCYCSTLGDCWTLHSGPEGNSTVETRTCPGKTATTFQQ